MKKNSGNALIFILIAVFLMGAITVVLTRSSGNTEETGDAERTSLNVSKLMGYTSSIQTAIQRMMMNGVSENDISFGNTLYQDCSNTPLQPVGHNAKCTTKSCEVFTAEGGGMTPMAVPDGIVAKDTCAFWKNGAMAINLKRVQKIGNDDNDELMLEVFGLTKEACLRINTVLGIPNDNGNVPHDDVSGGSTFSGTFTTFGPQIGNEYLPFIGKKAFCLESGGSNSFFTVLIPK